VLRDDPEKFARLGRIVEAAPRWSESGNTMHDAAWAPPSGIDPQQLREARLQAHHALQWLARGARAYVPPQPDDGHTNLGWDRALGGFATYPLKAGMWLSLRLTDLTLGLHAGEAGALLFPLEGRADAHVRQWLGEQLAARGFDAHALDAPSPYEMPTHAVSEGAAFGPAAIADALAELAAWFGNAALSLGVVHERAIARKLDTSPVRCWPHHFDLATLITLAERNPVGYVAPGCRPATTITTSRISMSRSIPSPTPRHFRPCRRPGIGICAILPGRLRPLAASSRPRTRRPKRIVSLRPRSMARAKSSHESGFAAAAVDGGHRRERRRAFSRQQYVGQLMPDIFLPLAVLALYLHPWRQRRS
jgi:hypothetical protein